MVVNEIWANILAYMYTVNSWSILSCSWNSGRLKGYHVETHTPMNPWTDFLMVILTSSIAHECIWMMVMMTTATMYYDYGIWHWQRWRLPWPVAVLNITIKVFFFEATCSKLKSWEARLTLFWPFLMHNWRIVNLI